jgi:hypothetical protein
VSGRPSGRSSVRLAGSSWRESGQPCFSPSWTEYYIQWHRLSRELYPTDTHVDFKAATDILTRRITADEIADAAGVSISSIARARLDPASSAYRSPPEDWETVLARLARERTEDFKELAEQLERQAQGKRS